MCRHILTLLAIIALLTSCRDQYSIHGTSSIQTLDGRMLYLKAVQDNELRTIDSSEVVHGQFRFGGTLDSVCMATLFMDEQSVMPIVLEEGDIVIKLELGQQVVGGTPLNDRLYLFIDKHSQLENQMQELNHKEGQMVMDGMSLEEVNSELAREASAIAAQIDTLETNFIVNNFDNVLGPGVFMMICSAYQYPVLTPQIEDIMSKATETFRSNPFVNDYYKTAQENMMRMQGLDPAAQPADSTLAK